MDENKKKDIRKLLKEEELNSVTGGGKSDKEGTCPYCFKTYTNGWGKHMTDGSCDVYPHGM